MESPDKLSNFCRFTKERCPYSRNNTCRYLYHRSETELYSIQPIQETKQKKVLDLFHEEIKAQELQQKLDFVAQNQPQLSVRGGFRGRGRGTYMGSGIRDQQQQYPRQFQQQSRPVTEELKERHQQMQQMEQLPSHQPIFQANPGKAQEETKKINRNCKFGDRCHDRILNKCRFNHNEEPNQSNQQDQNQQQNSMQDNQNKDIKAQNQHVNKMPQCNYGAKCRALKTNSCRFSHDPVVAPQNHEEEKKYIVPITDQQRDHPLKNSEPRPVQQPEPAEDEEVKQSQVKPSSKSKFFYTDLKAMVEIENEREFIRALIEIKGGIIEKINNTEFDRDMPFCMINFLEKMLKQDSDICRDIIHNFVESNFFNKISEYILKNGMIMAMNDSPKNYQFMKTSIWTMNQLMGMYQSQIEKFQGCILQLYSNANLFAMQTKVPAQKDYLDSATKLLMQRYQESFIKKEEIKHEQKPSTLKKVKQEKVPKVDESYKNEPVADFKKVEVVPGYRELEPLTEAQLKLIRRRMPEKGDLMNAHNYLDIVFRLLHEDAIADLRNGIDQLRKFQEKGADKNEIRKGLKDNQVKIYENLTIQSLEVTEGARCIQFRLPQHKKRLVDWRISKKLMGGSLVILTCDGFQNFVIGLLKNGDSKQRNEMQAKYGYIPINIEILKQSDYQEFNSLNFIMNFKGFVFDMVESSAYFESYRHVLLRLQEMDRWQIFPMQQLLVNCNREAILQPPYLREIMREHQEEIKQDIAQMRLDDSQQNALVHSLTTNFSLIQGPPGTGKTFIGVQIVKLLIKYKKFWCKEGPILLVTYTNHALEQFLHFIKDITREIVRIGGRTDSEDLAQFGLHERLRDQRVQRGQRFFEARDAEKKCQILIEKLKVKLLKFEYKCISTMVDSEEEGVFEIMSHINKNFMQYLNSKLTEKMLDIHTQDLIQNRLRSLRQTTQTNIIGLFWLEIIDLEKFIDFIIEDEGRKDRIKLLRSQIDIKNNKIKDLARKIGEKIKVIQTNTLIND